MEASDDDDEDDGEKGKKASGSDQEESNEEKDDDGDDGDDAVAPTLIPVKIVDGKAVPIEEYSDNEPTQKTVDLSSMTPEERAKLSQEVSATRVFTAAEFAKMRKLVERQERLKRDPRAAARIKRRRAQGKDFEELSDDDDESDVDSGDEERVYVKGAVSTNEIMADTKKKRASKIERLEKVLAGREQFEHKNRDGGSTNTEKKRKKNFLMTKFSAANRTKQGSKDTARRGILQKTKKNKQMKHENKKRRRRM